MVQVVTGFILFLFLTTAGDTPTIPVPQINRAVVIAVDGVRRQEALPAVKKLKTSLHGIWHSDGCAVSQPYNMSLPAYATMFSGKVQEDIRDNEFQGVVQSETFFTLSRGELYSAWDPIKSVMGNPSYAMIVGGSDGYDDKHIFKAYLKYNRSPQLAFIHFGDTDEAAHSGNWNGYVNSLERAVHYTEAIISVNEAEKPSQTLYVLLTDHGRGSGYMWRHHGKWLPESSEIWVHIVAPQSIRLQDCSHVGVHNLVRSYLNF